jgi:hypothetical protein
MFQKTIQHIPYKICPRGQIYPFASDVVFPSAVDNPLYPALSGDSGLYYHPKIGQCLQWTLPQELGRSCMYAGMRL